MPVEFCIGTVSSWWPVPFRLVGQACRLLHLQDGKKPAIPKLDELLAPDSDSEEEPDLELQLPANKVKYMVGQGGDKIKYIQRKTKCRIQVRVALPGRCITQDVQQHMQWACSFDHASRCSLPFRPQLILVSYMPEPKYMCLS